MARNTPFAPSVPPELPDSSGPFGNNFDSEPMKSTRLIKLSVVLVLASAGAALSGCTTAPTAPLIAPQPSPLQVKVIAFNDFHGNLKTPSNRVPVPDATQSTGIRFDPAGGVAQFGAVIKSLKAKNPNYAVVSAGDMVGATPLLSALFKDEPTIEAMNLVGVDFHGVGNHEFDYGAAHLKRLQAGGCAINQKTRQPDCGTRAPFTGANFQFLAANVVEDATGKTIFPPYGIKIFEGIKVAFIGMTLRDTPSIVRPGGTEGLTFLNEVATVKALIPELQKQGVEAVVVVVHEGGIQSGGINDCINFSGRAGEIAEQLPAEISVVITAHTHRFYVCKLGDKLVTSAGSYGTLVTEIDLTIDRTSRKIIAKSAKNNVVNPSGAKDEVLAALVEKYQQLAEPLESSEVAKITSEISLVSNLAGESTLGNLIADAHLLATAAPDKGGAVIAFNNPGSLRAPIIPAASGSVSYGALFKVQPFQNDLITMTLTGAQIKAVLEQQFSASTNSERPRLLGVSKGFSYHWDASKPQGDRIIASSIRLNGMQVKSDLQYRVTANSFVAGGSEGYTSFREGTERQVGILDLEALLQFFAVNSPFPPPALGARLSRIN